MMTHKELDDEIAYVNQAAINKNKEAMLSVIAVSLLRIANAQEAMYDLAVKDMNEAIDAAVEARSEEKAEELLKEKTQRSYIGKK